MAPPASESGENLTTQEKALTPPPTTKSNQTVPASVRRESAWHHMAFGTFATGGGDGIVSIWDSAAKKRLRQLPKYPGSITSLAFNSDGSKLAIACSILEEENPANNPNNNETDNSSGPSNKKASSGEDMKDPSAAPAGGDPDKG
ncbi:hypothetical protein Pst134EA_004908 [Puccinia striiformis f. sp. tritici]|nr:hypothetical protein Pst134EA_004908 [Puccinia striiformis f. sp. tritici]KAH9470998.1 hypothetical protein Pst134EA_004908 [Puccinia striiformis f. sp. tritici]POW15116.1 hypothetical protein PSTT_02439 [Puccinia striiformis]